MTQFPSPIPLPEGVSIAREKRNKRLLQASLTGIAIRLFVILIEFLGYAYFDSEALFMDALASSLDIVSSVVLIVCIKLAARPPDSDHPFGHGRYEPLAGLQLGVLLVVIGCSLLIQHAFKLAELPAEATLDRRVWLIPLLATLLLEVCYLIAMRSAKRNNSPALAAEAFHYRIDALTSLLATAALVSAAIIPSWSLAFDRVGAILIALFMAGLGINAFKLNVRQLMDRTPSPAYFDRVRNAAIRTPGVLGTEKIRIQTYGPDAHVDIDVEVDPQLPVQKAHRISQQVRAEIQKDWPSVRDVTVHIEPYYPGDHV